MEVKPGYKQTEAWGDSGGLENRTLRILPGHARCPSRQALDREGNGAPHGPISGRKWLRWSRRLWLRVLGCPCGWPNAVPPSTW